MNASKPDRLKCGIRLPAPNALPMPVLSLLMLVSKRPTSNTTVYLCPSLRLRLVQILQVTRRKSSICHVLKWIAGENNLNLASQLPLNLVPQVDEILLCCLELQSLLDPLLCLVQPAHLEQTLAPPPPALGVAHLLHLHTGFCVYGALCPVLECHVCLCAVAEQPRDLFPDET